MAQDDEIYFKVATDFGDLKPQFQDLSKYWDKHNQDIAKAEKAYRDYANTTDVAYKKVNQKIKDNIGQVAAEGKAVQQLETYFKSLNKETGKAFDSEDLNKFNKVLNEVAKTLGTGSSFNLELEDFDYLADKLKNAKDDLEATNVVLDFFEQKLNNSEIGVYGDKFEKTSDSIAKTRKELQEAEKYLSLVNNSLQEYQGRPASQKKASTFVDLKTEQADAKKTVDALTISIAAQEKELEKEITTTSSLSTQLRKVKDELIKIELAGGRGSKEWDKLREAATGYQRAIEDVNEEIKTTSSDTAGLDTLLGAATGIVGVFSAAEGAAALFGDESEDLVEVIVKLNGAIALLNGLQAIQAEVSKKSSLAYKGLAFVQKEYSVATNASAAATTRLGAALKLLGIGLIIGVVAALVVHWKDIAKAIGLVNEETEKLNEINKQAASAASGEIGRLKALELQLLDVNTPLKVQKDIKKELLEQYPGYLKVLGDEKTTAEEITTAFENLNKALLLNAQLKAAQELISTEYTKVLEAERKAANAEVSFMEDVKNRLIGGYSPGGYALLNADESKENLEEVKKDYSSFIEFIQGIITKTNLSLEKLGGNPETDGDKNKELEEYRKNYENFLSVLEKLINRRKELETSSIKNNRERDKSILTNQFEAEKEKYQKEIDAVEISQEKKLRLTEEFNNLYNEKNGIAYEEFRKGINEIDKKYDDQFNSVRAKTLAAINQVYLTSTELERKAIKDKYQELRNDILAELEQTENAVAKQLLLGDLLVLDVGEVKETKDFDKSASEDKLEREREIAKATLEIIKSNNKDILNLEELHKLELLAVDEAFYKEKLNIIKDSFDDLAKKDLLKDLTNQLQNAKLIEEIESIRLKLIEAFGEETSAEIIKIIEALNKIKDEVKETENSIKGSDIGKDITDTFSSFEGFFETLGKGLGLAGYQLEVFTKNMALFAESVYNSIKEYTDLEVQERQRKVDAIQDAIDSTEDEVDRERELYEEGYANNYEARKEDLENLKEQKKKEEEELKKAQKRKAALQKAEFLVQTAQQFGNLITASTNIFNSSTAAFGFAGVPIAVALIATMFGAFTAAKVKAFQAIGQGANFRTGLKKGRLSLDGPSHEEGGFGLYNSRSGQKVAEMESGEDILVFNRGQKRNYTHVIDALLADAKGEKDFETSMRNLYDMPKTGQQTLQVIERVNTVILKSQDAKSEVSKENTSMVNQIVKMREDFNREFNGYKKEREETEHTWETPEYFFVKKGNTTKKYKKKE